jgi:hypothetical protein
MDGQLRRFYYDTAHGANGVTIGAVDGDNAPRILPRLRPA